MRWLKNQLSNLFRLNVFCNEVDNISVLLDIALVSELSLVRVFVIEVENKQSQIFLDFGINAKRFEKILIIFQDVKFRKTICNLPKSLENTIASRSSYSPLETS